CLLVAAVGDVLVGPRPPLLGGQLRSVRLGGIPGTHRLEDLDDRRPGRDRNHGERTREAIDTARARLARGREVQGRPTYTRGRLSAGGASARAPRRRDLRRVARIAG